jgi:hypothetical protein
MTWNDLWAVRVTLGVLVAIFAFLLLAFDAGRVREDHAHLPQMFRIRLSATAVCCAVSPRGFCETISPVENLLTLAFPGVG